MNLYHVTTGLWRSGQPLPNEWPDLQARGIKYVLKLNDGLLPMLSFEHIYISDYYTQNGVSTALRELLESADAALDRLLTQGTVLVHCTEGVDRTGIVIARYRVRRQGWSKEAALVEWNQLGSHKYRGLTEAWNEWTP
jgi:tyrosine-protein phosphatase SIW14